MTISKATARIVHDPVGDYVLVDLPSGNTIPVVPGQDYQSQLTRVPNTLREQVEALIEQIMLAPPPTPQPSQDLIRYIRALLVETRSRSVLSSDLRDSGRDYPVNGLDGTTNGQKYADGVEALVWRVGKQFGVTHDILDL